MQWLRRLFCRHEWDGDNGRVIACLKCGMVVVMPCKHEWKVLDKTELPSGYEQLAKAGAGGQGIKVDDARVLWRKVVTLTVQCPKCGLLQVERTSNP